MLDTRESDKHAGKKSGAVQHHDGLFVANGGHAHWHCEDIAREAGNTVN